MKSMCSRETMCDVPYRNKILGHLVTREEELEAEIKKLKKRLNELEEFRERITLLMLQKVTQYSQQTCIVPYGYGDWRLQQQARLW